MCYSAHKMQDGKIFFAGPFPQKVLLHTRQCERLYEDKKNYCIPVFNMACIEIQLFNIKELLLSN